MSQPPLQPPPELGRLSLATSRAIRAHPVRQVSPNDVLRWLARGWADLMRCPLPGLLHGLAMALFGAAVFAVAHQRFWLLAGAFSGFLLVAPVVATGLYAVSRELERGGRPTLATVSAAWHPGHRRLVVFGLLLALAGTGWVLTSAALITGFAGAPVNTPADFVRVVVIGQGEPSALPLGLFEAWLMLGAAMAAPIFASSVVAIPLLLDRELGVEPAVLISVRAALVNPLPMALWATLILVFTLVGMGTLLIGLIVAGPWLAHASWHAYRDLIGPAQSGTDPAARA